MERHQPRKLLRLGLNLEFSSIRATKLMVARESQFGHTTQARGRNLRGWKVWKDRGETSRQLVVDGIHEFSSSTLK